MCSDNNCDEVTRPSTLVSIVIDVADRSNAFSKVCIESAVTTENSLLLHHPLEADKGLYMELAEDKKKGPTLKCGSEISVPQIKSCG